MGGALVLLTGIGLIVVGALRGEGRRGQAVLAVGIMVTAMAVALWGPEMYADFMEGYTHGRDGAGTSGLAVAANAVHAAVEAIGRFMQRLIDWGSRLAVLL